jgi:hypothetical protein
MIREPSDFMRVRNPTIPYLPYPVVGHADPAHDDARGGGVDGLKKSTEEGGGGGLHSSAGRGAKALVGSVGVFILKSSFYRGFI